MRKHLRFVGISVARACGQQVEAVPDAAVRRRAGDLEWFTVLGFEEASTLFRQHRNHTEAICSIGPAQGSAPPPLSVQDQSAP